jgi:VCBS repeat-containing protein
VDGDEVVQLYIAGDLEEMPRYAICAFQRIHLKAGESRQVSFTVAAEDIPKTKVEISVAADSPLPHVKGTL